MTEFEFEKKSQRYRRKDNKRYISFDAVAELREKAIADTQTNVESITQQMIDGDITVDFWEREMMANIKTRTIQLYQLGKPGEIDASDRGKLGNQVRFQYDKLWRFRNDILEEKLSEAQIKYRARMYLDKTRWAFEEGRRRSHYKAGYIWEKRDRNVQDSCVECIGYEAMGWQPLNTLPKVGESCTCRANCKCTFAYSDSVTKPDNSVQETLFNIQNSWLANPMKLQIDVPDVAANAATIDSAIAKAQAAFSEEIAKEIVLNANEPQQITQSPLNFGAPTPEQLAKMNRYRPKGSPPYKNTDVISVAYSASNNFVHHGNAAWSVNALNDMARQMAGRPFEVNHDWWDVEAIQGLIYDTEVTISDSVDTAIAEKIDFEANKAILQADGFARLFLYVMFEKRSDVTRDIYYRRVGDVSTGSFVDTDEYYCPIDGTKFGEGESRFQCAEGHYMPHPMLIYWFYEEEELENMAPYYVMNRVTDSVETSHVVQGALPAASLVLEG